MVQVSSKLLSIDEFVARYGDDARYELVDGELIDMEPTGPHEEVAALLLRKFNVQIDLLNLPWFTPGRCLIKPLGTATAFRPDVVVLDRAGLAQEPLWQDEPIITLGTTVKLVAEVVSTNWPNDYARKVEDYAALGIQEYWIADYAALGGRQFIGYPKQPTLSIHTLTEEDVYAVSQCRGQETIHSPTFPDLKLTAAQVLQPGLSS
ncbi:MAG: Uma2 family endonuclease [Cyanobacteria bacterium P01_D01_bin.44]